MPYEIRVRGRLTEAVVSSLAPVGAPAATIDTVLSGTVEDQAALFGLMSRMRLLGLDVVNVQRVPRRPA